MGKTQERNAKRLTFLALTPLSSGCATVEGGMGRPKKGAEIGAKTQIGVRVSEGLRAALDKIAARNKRSISDEARIAIEEHVAAAGLAVGDGTTGTKSRSRSKARGR
jgi:hypothetical protein